MTHAGEASLTGAGFNLGTILHNAWTLFARHFATFVALSAVTMLPMIVIAELMIDQRSAGFSFGKLVVLLVASTALGSVGAAVILYGALQGIRGRPVSALESLRVVLPHVGPVIALAVMNGLALMVGCLLLVVPGVILATILFAAIPACVAERLGPLESWHRSAELTKGHRWRVFWLIVLLFVISQIIDKGLLQAVLGSDRTAAVALLSYAWSTVFYAYEYVVIAVAYVQLRALKDGLNAEHIAEALTPPAVAT